LVVDPAIKERGLDSQAGMQLIRIVQEGLANVRKHAHASSARVVFALDAGQVQVRIEDDGVGFDVERISRSDGHRFGLRSMRERAAAIGGTLQVLSAPGCGTRVIVEAPCDEASTGLAPEHEDRPRVAGSEQAAIGLDRSIPRGWR
jgi:signal transduction histidine kinase